MGQCKNFAGTCRLQPCSKEKTPDVSEVNFVDEKLANIRIKHSDVIFDFRNHVHQKSTVKHSQSHLTWKAGQQSGCSSASSTVAANIFCDGCFVKQFVFLPLSKYSTTVFTFLHLTNTHSVNNMVTLNLLYGIQCTHGHMQ